MDCLSCLIVCGLPLSWWFVHVLFLVRTGAARRLPAVLSPPLAGRSGERVAGKCSEAPPPHPLVNSLTLSLCAVGINLFGLCFLGAAVFLVFTQSTAKAFFFLRIPS